MRSLAWCCGRSACREPWELGSRARCWVSPADRSGGVPQSARRALPSRHGFGRGARRDPEPDRRRCFGRGPRLGRPTRRHRRRVHRRGARRRLLTISLSRGVLQTASLLLSGIVVAFLLGAITQLLLLAQAGDLAQHADLPARQHRLHQLVLGRSARRVFCLCVVPASLLSRGLDALTLGEDTAQSLGLSLPVLRLTLLGIVSLATATAVGQVGVVGFVGLIAPHLVRETLSVNHRQLLIAAPLCGGALLQAADLASRWVIRPAELPVGAVTACVGGSYLVFLLWRRSRHGLSRQPRPDGMPSPAPRRAASCASATARASCSRAYRSTSARTLDQHRRARTAAASRRCCARSPASSRPAPERFRCRAGACRPGRGASGHGGSPGSRRRPLPPTSLRPRWSRSAASRTADGSRIARPTMMPRCAVP